MNPKNEENVATNAVPLQHAERPSRQAEFPFQPAERSSQHAEVPSQHAELSSRHAERAYYSKAASFVGLLFGAAATVPN